MNQLQIDTPGDSDTFYPGAEIEVYPSWNLEQEPEAIELRLVWNTSGKGNIDVKVVNTVRIDHPPARDQQTIPLSLPWGPYSFSGKLISLIWAIELVVFPDKTSTRREITIAPHGEEVLIGAARES